jgi:uroporphyrinogen decarboxylase
MTKRDVVRQALNAEPVPYVPWHMGFTLEAAEKLKAHYGTDDLGPILQNHFYSVRGGGGIFTDIGNARVRDLFGVVWDRSVDKDIGVVEGQLLPEPTLEHYTLPDPRDPILFDGLEAKLADHADLFRVFNIGFSLYERAWTLRGMEALMMDFYDNPDFVHALLKAIGDYNVAQVEHALTYAVDGVQFGDDWGQQHGLQMGPEAWRTFIKPVLARMYGTVKRAGRRVLIHSCGDVDELFDDLVAIGLDCFNPFQPEVMDVHALLKQYHGRLAFHGGLSTQKTLPYGSVDAVRAEVRRLIEAGRRGGYIFAPAHAVEGDVPVENLVAMIETVQAQPGYTGPRAR